MNLKILIESTPSLLALGQNYPAIAAAINEKPMVDNSSEQDTIPKPLLWQDLLALVPITEKANFLDLGSFQAWAKAIILDAETSENTLLALDSVLTVMAGETGQDVLGAAKYLAELGDRNNLKNLASVCVSQGLLSVETAAAIQTEIDTTILDPGYQLQVLGQSLAEQNDLGVVTEFDVQNALN